MTDSALPGSTRFSTPALNILRIGFSAMVLVFHGSHKLTEAIDHFRSGQSWKLIDEIEVMGLPLPTVQACIATAVQVGASLLLALGLWTRPSSLLLAAVMAGAVAQNISTGRDPQLAILYMMVALYFFGFGPGPWSLDAQRQRSTP